MMFASFDYSMRGTTIRFWNQCALLRSVHVPGEIGYFHDFAVTESYIIFLLHSLEVDTAKVLTHGAAGCLRSCEGTRVCVVTDDDVRWHAVAADPNVFVTHVANVAQTDSHIEIDAICYAGYMNIAGGATLSRFAVPRFNGTEKAIVQKLSNTWCEFPVRLEGGNVLMCSGSAHPLQCMSEWRDGSLNVVFHRQGWIVSEPTVATCGCVMFLAYDCDESRTKLVILAAPSWDVLCVLDFPDAFVPIGIHGEFIDASV
jgi:carotenoid cleavage dioxygenase-like enzyme